MSRTAAAVTRRIFEADEMTAPAPDRQLVATFSSDVQYISRDFVVEREEFLREQELRSIARLMCQRTGVCG